MEEVVNQIVNGDINVDETDWLILDVPRPKPRAPILGVSGRKSRGLLFLFVNGRCAWIVYS